MKLDRPSVAQGSRGFSNCWRVLALQSFPKSVIFDSAHGIILKCLKKLLPLLSLLLWGLEKFGLKKNSLLRVKV